ncbi:methyl-accepting chemotaxis protein [Bacillus andreraoultii]|uniref:methyl-accepting chemotaxis protein n=1 Tax=Bacillus andreraoultii TaxID=1499685 RepID=UPI00067F0A54|nr:methyl-accepting chemotaxis protein [Bacillus andreraoultii]
MTIQKKMISAFSIILLLLVIISGYTYYQFTVINKSYSKGIKEGLEVVKLGSKMVDLTRMEQVSINSYLQTGNQESMDAYKAATNEFYDKAKTVGKLNLDPEGEKIFKDLIYIESQFRVLADQYVNYKSVGAEDKIKMLMLGNGNTISSTIADLGDKVLVYQEKNLAQKRIELSQQVEATKTISLIISILTVFVGLIVAIFISRKITKPVQELAGYANKIADGDLTIEDFRIKMRDEIGDLSNSFKKMVNNLKTLIGQVGETSEQVAASSEQLMASAEQTSSVTNQVVTAIQEVASGNDIQAKNLDNTFVTFNEISSGMQKMAETTSTIAKFASDTAGQAKNGNNYIRNVIKQMNAINTTTNETNEVIKELSTNTSEIGAIINVITEIAEQTNLLALNAAIESARAGEHGKGFSVVANEVKKLAQASRESAKQISNIITNIQNDTVHVIEKMNDNTNEVANGLKLVTETEKTFSSILSSVDTVNIQIQDLSAIAEEISSSFEQVSESVEEIVNITNESVKATNEIASLSEEQLAAIQEIAASASTLSNMADGLREMIKKFVL